MNVRHVIALVSALQTTSLFAADKPLSMEDWQLQIALQPPGYILSVEDQQQRVWILEGLHSRDIDQVMTDQFDRLEHLMFVKTRHEGPAGEEVVDDEGCD